MSGPAESNYEFDVFLSHNSKDKAVVREVGQFLEENGIRVWLDEWEIDFGQSIPTKVHEGVKKSQFLLLFLSQHFADSDWGNHEHETVQFIDPLNKQGRVLPFKIDATSPPEHIAPFRYFDFHADSNDALRQLLNKLRGKPLKPDFAKGAATSRPTRAELVPSVPGGPYKLHGLPNVDVKLFGRDPEQDTLDAAWKEDLPRVVGLIGEGGQGKSVLLHTWLNDFRRDQLRGAECVLVHSFYRQTTGTGGSSDDFLAQAFACLDLEEKPGESAGAKVIRLVKALRGRRTLLILDGVEPLQFQEDGVRHSKFADEGLRSLLQELAYGFNGLCVVSSRRPLVDLHRHRDSREFLELPILPVEPNDGTSILLEAGVTMSAAATDISRQAGGHALTLRILGRIISVFLGGDASRLPEILTDSESAQINLETVLEAVDQRLAPDQRCLLRLIGLFEAPARAEIISVFRETDTIKDVTESVSSLPVERWDRLADSLREYGLIWPGQDEIDAHTRVREYFGANLKEENEPGWVECHSRLFDRLCKTTVYQPDHLPGLRPLYQAVRHGCLADRQQEAFDEVYWKRIQRGEKYFSTRRLGALGSDLSVLANFFQDPWRELLPNLDETASFLLNQAATLLQGLGRPAEAIEPMQLSGAMDMADEQWVDAAIVHSNLSGLEVLLGRLDDAVSTGKRAISLAKLGKNHSWCSATLTSAADALHQRGERTEALALFREAERLQAEHLSGIPLLLSIWGERYVDLLLAEIEHTVWKRLINPDSRTTDSATVLALQVCAEIERRILQTLQWSTIAAIDILSIALDHISLARVRFYAANLGDIEFNIPQSDIQKALDGLRDSGHSDYRPKALLTASLLNMENSTRKAEEYLDEAQEIAERGPMPLYLADVHLHRARLFRNRDELAKARALIEKHEYWRRKEELEAAEEAAELYDW